MIEALNKIDAVPVDAARQAGDAVAHGRRARPAVSGLGA